MQGYWGEVVAVLAGLLLPFAFAPYDLVVFVLLSPAIFVVTWLYCPPKRALLRGYLFGLAYYGIGVSWISVSMIRFGNMSVFLSVFLTILFVAIWACFPAVTVYLVRRFFSRLSLPLSLLLLLPALWTFLEWTRSWVFTGYPWLSLGYTQVDGPLHGIAPLLGVYGISWLLILVAGGLVLLFYSEHMRYRVGVVALIAALVLGSSSSGRIEWTQAKEKPIKVSLIQGNIPQELKWHPAYRQSSIQLYTDLSRKNWDSDLIIWPETAYPAFFQNERRAVLRLGEEAKAHNTDMLIGIPMVDEDDYKVHYNSVIAIGSKTDFYHKRHLVPFGEYLPLKALLGDLLLFFRVPMANFSSGPGERQVLEVAGTKAGISICYEDVFGAEVIETLPEAEILVNVSNDAWFGDSFAPHQHLQMARMRAMETGRPMLRATNNGVSALIDHTGAIIEQSPQFELSVLTADIFPRTGNTVYTRLGNWPVIFIFTLSLIAAWVLQRRQI